MRMEQHQHSNSATAAPPTHSESVRVRPVLQTNTAHVLLCMCPAIMLKSVEEP